MTITWPHTSCLIHGQSGIDCTIIIIFCWEYFLMLLLMVTVGDHLRKLLLKCIVLGPNLVKTVGPFNACHWGVPLQVIPRVQRLQYFLVHYLNYLNVYPSLTVQFWIFNFYEKFWGRNNNQSFKSHYNYNYNWDKRQSSIIIKIIK